MPADMQLRAPANTLRWHCHLSDTAAESIIFNGLLAWSSSKISTFIIRLVVIFTVCEARQCRDINDKPINSSELLAYRSDFR